MQKTDEEISNIMYVCKTLKKIPGEENTILIGAEDKNITKVNLTQDNYSISGTFQGHSAGIRSLDVSKDAQTLASGCMDHSIRLWDYTTGKGRNILCGHQDVVTGTAFLNENTLISTSWDLRILVWNF